MGSSRPPAAHDRDPASLLGFQFRDPSLFHRALVHRSYCNEHGLTATESYERLEFLGDAVLELTVSAHLYRQFPDADEGRLTKARSSLVRDETLARVARRWGLGECLLVGRGVEDSGGRDQDSVLAATLEAILGAVYLDQGLEAAREFVNRHMSDELAEMNRDGPPPENPKSRLQELLQGQGRPTPTYRLAHREGPDHNPVFSVEAVVGDEVIGVGRGGKKSEAERAAAETALAQLSSAPPDSSSLPHSGAPSHSGTEDAGTEDAGAENQPAPRHRENPPEAAPPKSGADRQPRDSARHSSDKPSDNSNTTSRFLRRLGLGRRR